MTVDKSVKVKLGDFKVYREAGLENEGSVVLQQLTPDGKAGDFYCYLDETAISEAGYEFLTTPGWYLQSTTWDEEPVCGDNIEIPYGSGAMIQCALDNVTVTFAGEVVQGNGYSLTLNSDLEVGTDTYTWTGNSSPVIRTLSQFGVYRTAGLENEGSVVFQPLTKDGKAGDFYCYLDETAISEAGYEFLTTPGWYLQSTTWDEEPVTGADVILNPGDVGMIQCALDGVEFTIPSAL